MHVPFRVVLATASRWRAKLLADTGVVVDLHPAPIDEAAIGADDPVSLAFSRARAKADSVAQVLGDAFDGVVIGADQVAHVGGEAFGKPLSPADHRQRLRQLRGRAHTLSTAVSLRGARARALGTDADFVEHTHLHFRADVTDDEIDAYVATGDGAECAGGYRAEGPGAWLIERIDGDGSNVIGLPVLGVLGRLRRMVVAG